MNEGNASDAARLVDRAFRFFDSLTNTSRLDAEEGAYLATYEVTMVTSPADVEDLWRSTQNNGSRVASDSSVLTDPSGGAPLCITVAQWTPVDGSGDIGKVHYDVVMSSAALRAALIAARGVIEGPEHDTTLRAEAKMLAWLLGCPLDYGQWNQRKRNCLIHRESRHYVACELNLTALVTAIHPKVPEAWEHRRFIWEQVLMAQRPFFDSLAVVLRLLDLHRVVPLALRRHPRCYPLWEYRRFLVMHTSMGLAAVEEEISALLNLLDSDASEASAAFQIGFYLHHLLANASASEDHESCFVRCMDRAMCVSQRLLSRFSRGVVGSRMFEERYAHEAAWTLRRAVLSAAFLFSSPCGALRHRSLWRGWTIDDELAMIDLHCSDCWSPLSVPEVTVVPRAFLRCSDASVFWTAFAARYGLWFTSQCSSAK